MIVKLSLLFILPVMTWAKAPDVESYILRSVQEQVQKECATCKVELRLFNKQSIDDIAIPDKVYSDHWKGQTNLVLQLGNNTRIVTADIRWMDRVVVASENIKQGQIIAEKDLRVIDQDVTFIKTPYVRSEKQASGFLSRRVFQRGQIIDEGMLKKPLAIRYGQPVKLEINEGSLILTMSAMAKGAGAIGDQIPVYIPSTQKKIFAKIINDNVVRAE